MPINPWQQSADLHSYANGQHSVEEDDSMLSGMAKYTASLVTRTATSVLNTVPSTVNFAADAFGSEYRANIIDTEEVIRHFDDNVADYYAENRDSIDVVGDIAASFVPGLVGVKVLNYGQKALGMVNGGNIGARAARGLGLLPTMQKKYLDMAVSQLANNTYRTVNANTMKALVSGLGQAYLEGAAFTVASGVAMKDFSPIFEKQTTGDILANAVTGGGLIGLGTTGVFTSLSTWGKYKSAVKAIDLATAPYKHISETPIGAPGFAKLMTRISDLNATKIKNVPADMQSFATRKADTVSNLLRTDIQGFTQDKEIGDAFHKILMEMDNTKALNDLAHLENIGRMVDILPEEKMIQEAAKIGMSAKDSVKFVKILGDGAGDTFNEVPEVLSIGDRLKNSEEVMKKVKGFGFKNKDIWNFSSKTDEMENEARHIWARGFMSKDFEGMVLGKTDIPMLDRAYITGVNSLKLEGGITLNSNNEIFDYIQSIKNNFITSPEFANISTGKVAKALNVRRNYIEGVIDTKSPVDDFIVNGRLTDEELLAPSIIKLGYNPREGIPSPKDYDLTTYLKQIQILQQSTHDKVIGNFSSYIGEDIESILPERLDDAAILGITRFDTGNGFLTSQSGNYGSPVSRAGALGNATNRIFLKMQGKLAAEQVAPMQAVKQSPAAAAELVGLHKIVRSSSEGFALFDDATLVKKSFLDKLNDGKLVLDDLPEDAVYHIQSPELRDWVGNWIKTNDAHNIQRINQLAASGIDISNIQKNLGNFYLPPPDPRKYPYHAFVVDDTITGNGHVEMVYAKSPAELSDLVARVPSGQGLKVYYPKDTKEYFQAYQMYDQSLGLKENYINHALARTGKGSEFFPRYDTEELMQEILDWRLKTEKALVRDMISMRESKYFSELHRLAAEHTAIEKATYKTIREYAESTDVKNPYIDIIKTSLDIQKNSDVPIWGDFNRFAERTYSKAINGLKSLWSGEDSVESKITQAARLSEDAGLGNPSKELAKQLFPKHPVGEYELTQHVGKLNGLMSTFVLRTDPMHAVTNGIGHQVLLWSETRNIIKEIEKGSADEVGKWAELGKLKVPGTDKSIVSPAKLIGNAYKAWFKNVMGDADAGAMKELFKKHGWITDIAGQEKQILDLMTIRGDEVPGKLSQNLVKAAKGLEKMTLNASAEEMNRFVSAHIAYELSSRAKMPIKEAISYINEFVNRTNGVYLASQRPLLFSGPIGKAIGLFQTYQFNLLQHIFRYAEKGNVSQMAYLGALQGSIFGMSGLPAFNAINTYLVGNAYGNKEHSDIYSTVFDAAGHEAGQWLMYGISSNMLMHPDLKMNLYTRGDINPRHLTVIPTNPADVPIINAAGNVFRSAMETAKQIGQGAPVDEAILRGIEHMQLSRPLAGLSVVLQGHSTTQKGNIIAENDLYSLTSIARLLGARPLDEAMARDAYYRVQAYEGAMYNKINSIGKSIKAKVQSGSDITEKDVESFLEEYVHAGGDQKNFQKFWQRQIKVANENQIKQLMWGANTSYSKYMQKLMGGSEMYEEN